MSSLVDKFPGAEVVAGAVIYNRKTVVLLRSDQEILTPDGEEALKEIERTVDVEATEVVVGGATPSKPAAKTASTRKPREPKSAAPAPAPAPAEPEAPAAGGENTGASDPA